MNTRNKVKKNNELVLLISIIFFYLTCLNLHAQNRVSKLPYIKLSKLLLIVKNDTINNFNFNFISSFDTIELSNDIIKQPRIYYDESSKIEIEFENKKYYIEEVHSYFKNNRAYFIVVNIKDLNLFCFDVEFKKNSKTYTTSHEAAHGQESAKCNYVILKEIISR